MPLPRGACLIVALLVLAPAARSAPWALMDASPTGSVAAASVRDFATDLATATGGAVTVAAPSGTAADPARVLESVAAGRAALGVLPLAALEGDHPVLALDRVPYLATNYVQARKLWQVLRPRVEDVLAAKGVILLYAVAGPPPAPLSRMPLRSLQAWQGARVLLGEPALEGLARRLGAVPARAGSAREALGGGKADVAFVAAAQAAREKAWEYAGHYLHAPAWFPKQLVVVNRAALAGLAAPARDALLSAADRAGAAAWTRSEQATDEAVQRLRDYGVKTARPPVQVDIALENMGRELLFLWSDAAGETGATLVEGYYAIR